MGAIAPRLGIGPQMTPGQDQYPTSLKGRLHVDQIFWAQSPKHNEMKTEKAMCHVCY